MRKRRVQAFWMASTTRVFMESFLEWRHKIELLSPPPFHPGWWKWNRRCDSPAWQFWGNLCDQQKTVQLMWHLMIPYRFAALSGGGWVGSAPKEAAVFLRVSIHVCTFAVCGEVVGSARCCFTPKMIMTRWAPACMYWLGSSVKGEQLCVF